MDDNLIILAKAGDETAIEKLVGKAWEKALVLVWVYYDSISMQDLEDVFQEVMIKYFDNPLTVEAKTDKQFCNWVMVCCKNKILDIIRSQHYKSKVPLTTMNEEGEEITSEIEYSYNLEEDLLKNEIDEHIIAEIKKLDEIDRKIILLLYSGYLQREISERLGISYDNIRQRKSRAVKKLAGKLKGYLK